MLSHLIWHKKWIFYGFDVKNNISLDLCIFFNRKKWLNNFQEVELSFHHSYGVHKANFIFIYGPLWHLSTYFFMFTLVLMQLLITKSWLNSQLGVIMICWFCSMMYSSFAQLFSCEKLFLNEIPLLLIQYIFKAIP